MDTVTYPAQEVVDFINNYLIPLRLKTDDDSIHEKYQTIWTPTIAILDINGDEIQRKVGFFSPREFIASLHLGIAKVHLDAGDYDTAEVHLKSLLEDFAETEMVPEALFFRGVNLYKMHNDPSWLKTAYERLLETHPDNSWTQRAYPYRLL